MIKKDKIKKINPLFKEELKDKNQHKLNIIKIVPGDNFASLLKKSGINLQVHYNPVHLMPYYRKNYGFKRGDFPVSESFYRCESSLPIYPALSKDSVDLVISKILEIISVWNIVVVSWIAHMGKMTEIMDF